MPKPQLFDAIEQKRIVMDDELFPNPRSIKQVHWSPDSSRFFFLYNQRGHQVLCIITVDARTGDMQVVIDEQSKTFIDYDIHGLIYRPMHFDPGYEYPVVE
ncbi:DPP IV N-terminal domain-containing protein [Candidatus Poribacteria bacterium]